MGRAVCRRRDQGSPAGVPHLTSPNPTGVGLYHLLAEKKRRLALGTSSFSTLYPDSGKYGRDVYRKHIEFFAAGATFRERGLLGGNRVGKTLAGAFETTCHLTGLYPPWWTGRRFPKPTRGWAAGDTSKTVAEIMQAKLMGTPTHPDAGLIPRSLIRSKTRKTGVPDAYASINVEHVTGGTSVLSFKSYDQKRISFQGTAQDFIWLDEEVDESIYEECVYRTLKTSDFEGGIIYLTFTPLMGLTAVVQLFIPDGVTASPDRFIIFVAWEDIPHLDEAEKAEIYRTTQPYMREARTKGIPQLGSGAIYPVPESQILVQPFEIPKHWTRGYGLDVGWNCTAAMFGAYDRENQTLYMTGEYKRGEGTPSMHADVIKNRAKGWPGFIDPASRGRSQDEGKQLIVAYQQLGLDVIPANNAVDVGIDQIWDMMTAGRFKVFSSLEQYKAELRLYQRDKKGIVVKKNDHLMDSKRYLNSRRDQMRVIAPASAIKTGPKYSGSMGFVR